MSSFPLVDVDHINRKEVQSFDILAAVFCSLQRGAILHQKMSLTAAVSGSIVLLLTVSVIWGQDESGVTYYSTQICALKGSKVDIRCFYTYPAYTAHGLHTTVEETLWFTQLKDEEPLNLRADSEYAGRVQDGCNKHICTLRIKDLRETDSAEYKFMFTTNQRGGGFTGSPGVTLTVTDLQVKMKGSVTHAELWCHSSCKVSENPSYIWYRNGKEIQRGSPLRVPVNEGNSYYCALEHEEYQSAAVYHPTEVNVSVSPSGDTIENKPMTLICSSDAKPAAKHTWYKKYGLTRAPYVSTVQPHFSSIKTSDSGEYFCSAENDLGNAPVETSVSVHPSSEIVEGTAVILRCRSDANPAAEYSWHEKTGKRSHERFNEGSYIYFRSIQASDSGQYYCTADNKLGKWTSEHVFVDVKYAPRLPSVSVSPSAVIVEGNTVTLTCSSDANPAARYTWHRKNERGAVASGKIYTIKDFKANDSGDYYCEAQNRRGVHNFTFHLPFVSKSSVLRMNTIRLFLSFLVLVFLLLLVLWSRKKKPLSSTTEAAEPAEMIESKNTVAQTEDSEEQEDMVQRKEYLWSEGSERLRKMWERWKLAFRSKEAIICDHWRPKFDQTRKLSGLCLEVKV
ncbi:basement membrane-specific heparan sulfate proteoglycan core protein-like [Halichoeres trimaculatus]|uniref:basement membrane-specific heparan sulfate proteoglycan core protein-like n=1 Tax=Halichoeres trimaculatus TaxID=147232 RepID=UPI003D9ED208